MPPKPLPLDIDDLVRRYTAGDSTQTIGESLGITAEPIRQRLIAAGVTMRPSGGKKRVSPASPDVVERYLGGESELALANSLGLDRGVLRRRLVAAGVNPRDRSQGMATRMRNTSLEERARLASAAHDARRGSKASIDELVNRALANEGRTDGNVSPAELHLADMLRGLGIDNVHHQTAVGPYNVDLSTGTIAVEVLGGSWHRAKHHRERLRYLLDSGWDVLYVWVDGRRWPLGQRAAEDVVAFAKLRQSDPAAPCRYRVIRGTGQFVAEGRANGDDLPDILPDGRTPNRTRRSDPR